MADGDVARPVSFEGSKSHPSKEIFQGASQLSILRRPRARRFTATNVALGLLILI
jgi:hypothetical protein